MQRHSYHTSPPSTSRASASCTGPIQYSSLMSGTTASSSTPAGVLWRKIHALGIRPPSFDRKLWRPAARRRGAMRARFCDDALRTHRGRSTTWYRFAKKWPRGWNARGQHCSLFWGSDQRWARSTCSIRDRGLVSDLRTALVTI